MGTRGKIAVLLCVALAGGVGGFLYHRARGKRAVQNRLDTESAAAEALVAHLRDGLPPSWSIERVLARRALSDLDPAWDATWRELLERVRSRHDGPTSFYVRDDFWKPSMAQTLPSSARYSYLDLARELRGLDGSLAKLRAERGLAPRPLPLDGEPLPQLARPIPILGANQQIARLVDRDVDLPRHVWPREAGIVVLSDDDPPRTWTVTWDGRAGAPLELTTPPDGYTIGWAAMRDATLCSVGAQHIPPKSANKRRIVVCYSPGIASPSFTVEVPPPEKWGDFSIWATGDDAVATPSAKGFAVITKSGALREVDEKPAPIQQSVTGRDALRLPGLPSISVARERTTDLGELDLRLDTPSPRYRRIAEVRSNRHLELVAEDRGHMVIVIADVAAGWSVVFSRDGGKSWLGAPEGSCDENPWCESPEQSCSDDFDNDDDGAIDCADTDCAAACPKCDAEECARSFCGREEECQLSWNGDGSCECGCSFCDVDCPSCASKIPR